MEAGKKVQHKNTKGLVEKLLLTAVSIGAPPAISIHKFTLGKFYSSGWICLFASTDNKTGQSCEIYYPSITNEKNQCQSFNYEDSLISFSGTCFPVFFAKLFFLPGCKHEQSISLPARGPPAFDHDPVSHKSIWHKAAG
jgi:hypothetical protein